MSKSQIRRAQLISPFGVGAMSVMVNGSSVITAGLDHWYESRDPGSLFLDEYLVPEWRLQERLHVSALRLPPDHRTPTSGQESTNVGLTVPVLRFPRWCFCMYCKRLTRTKLSMSQPVRCVDAKHAQKKQPIMSQVPFVAICEGGHLSDFPFFEWVHRSTRPSCPGVMRLTSQGGGSLAGQVVKCDGCNASRSLEGITQSTQREGIGVTILSDRLDKTEKYLCAGERPWVADPGRGCGLQIRGALRAAGNVYFPKVESSIYLPRTKSHVRPELREMLRRPDVFPKLEVIKNFTSITAAVMRTQFAPELTQPFSDSELDEGLADLFGPADEHSEPTDVLSAEAAWRTPEYETLRGVLSDVDLTVKKVAVPGSLDHLFGRVRRVDVLRETRVLRGFTRVRDAPLKLSDGKAQMRRDPLSPSHDWLPATVVRGEGIYLEFEEERLVDWESRADVQRRTATMQAHALASRFGTEEPLTARFVLIHTFAHLFMNELIFACGYSSASLRERLYVASGKTPMSGLLIYTAAGDSEGTMGGLVRMAKPENLGPVLTAAFQKASWCSTDPVCMEVGELGQGPDSCNLAACHACALVPETSCETFNRYLDRALVCGTPDNPSLGYFTP